MADGLRKTGAAQVGWISVSWPLVELSVSPRALVLRTLIGTYAFTPEQVVRLEPYGFIPILYRGIRIVHANPDCPSRVIFWCFGRPERLIERIRQARFIPGASPLSAPARRGMPFRWSFILALVAAWNALFIVDDFVPWRAPQQPGPFVALAVALVFLASFAAERSAVFRKWVLRPGRSVGEIRPVLRLIRLATGLILVVLFVMLVTAGRLP